ncbi:hypothetical protein [uncultured Tenacibaculum sp.]|uniref:hypothetical protein n=1 Tax=uncultured Tenacibaculum sp. TaxID=174713 RepID=UPI0026175690|nr:hypothetical protein [uncultured Tenacibaculum sp.]
MQTKPILSSLLKLLLILSFILTSCKKETNKKSIPKFNLITDITNFKKKMSELDTIKIWFNHSVCTYRGVERVKITKESDSIKIRTEYKEQTFEKAPKWKLVFEKKIPSTDTIWKFEEFLIRNNKRQRLKKLGTLQISHNKVKVHYTANGLADLNRFMADYYETMKILHPENKNGIYGIETIETEEIE